MDDIPQPRDGALTLLKWLVIGLTATMLVGMIALVGLFFSRFKAPTLPLGAEIDLPEGVSATALTRGTSFVAIVTDTDEILIYDPTGQILRDRITINTE